MAYQRQPNLRAELMVKRMGGGGDRGHSERADFYALIKLGCTKNAFDLKKVVSMALYSPQLKTWTICSTY